jgi:transposase
MERVKTSTKCAGVDVGKCWLDVAVHGAAEVRRFANDRTGRSGLVAWLGEAGVDRVGFEASGGYEQALGRALEAAGLEVVMHQPLEVRLFARMKRLRAKTDRIDALLIAAATAQVDTVKAAADPRLRDLAERLTAYEQISDQLAQMKTWMEHVHLKDIATQLRTQMRSLKALKDRLARQVICAIRAEPDLAERYALLISLPGIGPIVAASLVVRMPELGKMNRGQPAALLGVAPFARESGQWKGQRFIGGGRQRPRRMVYLAALSAKRHDPSFRAIAERLAAAGKPPKLILVALMRRLIEAANLILSRGQPWLRGAAA